jgi:hypothetical protein
MIILGGIIEDIQDVTKVIPEAYFRGYLYLTISWISIMPMPAASAVADPDIPPNIIDPTTFTAPSPPRIPPQAAFAKSKILLAIPPLAIMFPASIKKGMAMRMYVSRASYIMTVLSLMSCPVAKIAIRPPRPKQTAIGIPKTISVSATRAKIRLVSIISISWN